MSIFFNNFTLTYIKTFKAEICDKKFNNLITFIFLHKKKYQTVLFKRRNLYKHPTERMEFSGNSLTEIIKYTHIYCPCKLFLILIAHKLVVLNTVA